MATGGLQRIAGSRHKKCHELRVGVSGQHGRSLKRGDGIAQSAKDLVGVRSGVVGVSKHTDLRIIVEEPSQLIGRVLDLERVLIVRPRRVRGLGDGHTQVLTVRSPAWTTHDPSIGISVDPYDRIAPDLGGTATVRLALPEVVVLTGP